VGVSVTLLWKKTIHEVFKAVKAEVHKVAPGMNRLRAPAAIFRTAYALQPRFFGASPINSRNLFLPDLKMILIGHRICPPAGGQQGGIIPDSSAKIILLANENCPVTFNTSYN
jgi:hypothetical protein